MIGEVSIDIPELQPPDVSLEIAEPLADPEWDALTHDQINNGPL